MTDEAKKRAGRPPVAGTNTRKVSVTLDAETLAELERLGGGNLSAGVRRAVQDRLSLAGEACTRYLHDTRQGSICGLVKQRRDAAKRVRDEQA